MSNERLLLDYAEALNNFTAIDQIRDYYRQQAISANDDVYNHIVILLTMCINKSLHILLNEPDDDISVEMYPQKLNTLCNTLFSAYTAENGVIIKRRVFIDGEEFLSYLNQMVKALLSGVEYIEKTWKEWCPGDAGNVQNTSKFRVLRIYQNMRLMISENSPFAEFSLSHDIEIPYMYVLAHDLGELYRTIKAPDESNIRNTYIELKHIGKNLMDILFDGELIDRNEWTSSLISVPKSVDYTSLLPKIPIVPPHSKSECCKPVKFFDGDRTHQMPCIKKEVLKQIPFLPIKISSGLFRDPNKPLRLMIRLLEEESKTQDYVKSDIVYFKSHITDMCENILHLLHLTWGSNTDFTRIGKENAESYLTSIIHAVNADPRKTDADQRNVYIGEVTHKLAQLWEKNNLQPIKIESNNQDTYIEYAYFSVLKLTRNWSQHPSKHPLLEKPSMHFCVFLFLIAMRYTVNLTLLDIEASTKYYAAEAQLLRVLGKEKVPYNDITSEELSKEYLQMYKNVDPKLIKNSDPHSILTAAGHENSPINSKMGENEIFLTFWLCIHMGQTNIVKRLQISPDGNLFEILGRTFGYQKESNLLHE